MPVLGTKLHVPAMRRRLVSRSRLTDRLRVEPSSMPRLILVSAPAGFGKTTLIAQWLASGGRDGESEPAGPPPRVAWLSLDAGDSELRRFVTHLVAAIQVSSPQVGAEALALLDSGRTPPAEVLVSLVNDLDELDGPTVLALDDYHVIDAPDIHESVTFLLGHLPPQVTIAITTRADPPLPLARLRGRGELLELRAADLRFLHPRLPRHRSRRPAPPQALLARHLHRGGNRRAPAVRRLAAGAHPALLRHQPAH